MLGILAPNKLFLNSISVFTVYTELETLPHGCLHGCLRLFWRASCGEVWAYFMNPPPATLPSG